jgi:hypothetical protein
MKNLAKKLIMVLALVLTAQFGFATTYTTVQDGDWSSTSTWDANGVPPQTWSTGDIINVNHALTISNDLVISYYVTNISSNGEIAGGKKITLKESGSEINNYGKIDVSDIDIGSNSGEAKIDNYGEIYVSSTFTVSADLNNKYQSSSIHGYIEVTDIELGSSGTIANDHHIKVRNNFTIQGSAGLTNNTSGILYVVNNLNITANTTITNDGKVYVDGKIDNSNGNIQGSGKQCHSDGQTDIPTVSGGVVQCSAGIGPIDGTFPIDLIFFTANPNQNQVELTWTTATEENNEFFTIERSQDGQNWEEIATIPGAGNSNELLQYSFVDQNPLEGQTYYHLKQTDYDGTSTYSEVRTVKLEGDMDNSIKVYPNPTLGQLQMDVAHVDIKEIHVLNIIGQDVTTEVSICQNGAESFTLDLSNLPKGMYFVQTSKAATKVYKQ